MLWVRRVAGLLAVLGGACLVVAAASLPPFHFLSTRLGPPVNYHVGSEYHYYYLEQSNAGLRLAGISVGVLFSAVGLWLTLKPGNGSQSVYPSS